MADPWHNAESYLANSSVTGRIGTLTSQAFINELTSRPGPSDRLATQRQAQAQAGGQNMPFDGSVADPNATNSGVGQPPWIRPNVPILHGDPTRQGPNYPGGIGPDAPVVGRIVSTTVPGGAQLWDLFTRTYNSRAKESVLPSQLPLPEVDPNVQRQVSRWMLMTDPDMEQRRQEYNNRDLRPQERKPGHFFAVGLDKSGNPINVLDYYWGDHNVTYTGQYLINYGRDQQGNMHTRVSHYLSNDQSHPSGPQAAIGSSRNTLEGTVDYTANNGRVLAMKHYNAFNTGAPDLQFEFNGSQIRQTWLSANNGAQQERVYPQANGQQIVNSQANKFYFKDLFGP